MKSQEAILKEEGVLKAWCPSSGEDAGRIFELPGTDVWRFQCPTRGAWWAGGCTVLADHDRPS